MARSVLAVMLVAVLMLGIVGCERKPAPPTPPAKTDVAPPPPVEEPAKTDEAVEPAKPAETPKPAETAEPAE